MATTPARTTDDDRAFHDAFIDESEAAESGARNLFDLRFIIGGMFLVYGVYLVIRGLTDSAAAIEQAAGVRINLWTGLGALALGIGFVAWGMMRPLTVEDVIEGQAEDVERELGDRAGDEPARAGDEPARHRPVH